MIRLRLFGRCRIYHDPVSPVLKEAAQIGWTSWFRDIDLVTPRKLKGKELLMRTRGWQSREIQVLPRSCDQESSGQLHPHGHDTWFQVLLYHLYF